MAKYKYNAYREKENTFVNGEIEASSLREAREKILQLGFLPTKVYTETSSEENHLKSNHEITDDIYVKSLSLEEKILFSSELEVLLSSQIPIIEALDMISNTASKEKIRRVAKGLGKFIKNGLTLKESLEKYEKVFDPVFIGLISAGETTGDISAAFSRLLGLLRKQKATKEKIISASIYPSILILLIIGVLALFGGFILPRFCAMYSDLGIGVSGLTAAVWSFTKFMSAYGIFVFAGLFGFFYGIYRVIKSGVFKNSIDNFLLKLPFINNFIRTLNLSNFIAVLGIAYDAGIPISSSVNIASASIKNNVIKDQAEVVEKCLNKGETLSTAFIKSNILDISFMSLIKSGEKSGEIGKMLEQIANILDRRVEMVVDTLAKSFEPALIIIIGVIVGVILLAFYPVILGGIPV